MRIAFHDRDDETRRLHRFLRNATAELAIVYGRRRCGKSTLLQRGAFAAADLFPGGRARNPTATGVARYRFCPSA